MSRFLLPILVFSSLTVIATAPAASAAGPTMSLSLSGSAEVIAGDDTTYDFAATNTDGTLDGFNLGLILDVPVGVTFVSSSLGTPVMYDATHPPTTLPLTPIPAGIVRWVWEDVSDLPMNGTFGGSVTVHPTQPFPRDFSGAGETADTDVFPVGSTYSIDAYSALSSDPTYLPVFNGSTGVGGPIAEAATTEEGPTPATTDMIALNMTKSEPHPESELPRGVHDQTTVYTITIRNTTEGPTDNVILVDHIPAGLEFLGCREEDNSTVDREPADPTINEYLNAPLMENATPPPDCILPNTVDTIEATSALATQYGITEGEVYTQVTWNLGILTAGETKLVRYAAGIPLYENTVTWEGVGGAPTAGSLEQGSNLDNNNIIDTHSTRHGSPTSHEDGDTWTNVANVIGDYQGIVRTGADRATPDRADYTIYAMDLAILKTVTSGDPFVVGQLTGFNLHLSQSEYMNSKDIVITDTLPNGLCPLMPAGTTLIVHDGITIPAECLVPGTVTGARMVSVDAYGDGTFVIVFRPNTVADPNPDNFILGPNETYDITFDALNRGAYELAPSIYGPTTSGDGFGNTVEFDATDYAIPDLLDWFPDDWFVWDDSGAGIGSDLTTISKRVMPRDEVDVDLGPGVNPCTNGTFVVGPEPGFRLGDTVCFQLTVNFPSSIDVRNPVVTDFLPRGLTYAGHEIDTALPNSVPAGDIQEDATHAADGRLEWKLGHLGDLINPDLYVTRGQVLVVDLWATVDAPSNGPILDKPENLMKYRQQNVEGVLYFLRDQAEIEIQPELELVKGVESVLDNSLISSSTRLALFEDDPFGTEFASNRDGIEVREEEVVTYRVDLHTMPYEAHNAVVWDVLPAGITKADVSAISIPNLLATGTAYDPGDPGYPAGMDPTLNTRSVVIWTGVDVPYVGLPLEAQQTLTYDVTIPIGTSVATSHDNTASIISYTGAVNTSLDPDFQTYYPTDSYDTSLSALWNTPGTSTRDDSNVYLPSASVAKSLTTEFDVTNNGVDQAVKGEIVHFTYSATVPAHTTVQNGVLSDALPNPGYWTIHDTLTTVTYPVTDPPFDSTDFSLDTATGTLTFPTTHINDTDADQVFSVDLYAHVNPVGTWGHNTTTPRTNTATFTSVTQPPTTATADLYVITPNPTIGKQAVPDWVTAGETVTYTLTAGNNDVDNRPTSFDTQVIDCVPDGLTVITPSPLSPSQGTAIIDNDLSCSGTRIVWDVGSLLSGIANYETLTYQATVDPDAAGLATYTNSATITGYSLDDPPPLTDRATYSPDPTTEVVTVLGAIMSKTVDGPDATIGEKRHYTITVTLPADVNFYDAALIDDFPDGLSLDPASIAITCSYNAGLDDCMDDTHFPGEWQDLTAIDSSIGWWLGDVEDFSEERLITLTYTATVLDYWENVNDFDLVNTASLRWSTIDLPNGPLPDTSYSPDVNTSISATVNVVEPIVDIAKLVNGHNSDGVAPGEIFTYTVTVTNNGDSTAYDVTVNDIVPDGVIVDAGTISDDGTISGAAATGGGTISWDPTPPQPLLDLEVSAPNNTDAFTYDAILMDSSLLHSADVFTNVATVTGYYSHPTDPTGTVYDDAERRFYNVAPLPWADAVVTPDFPDPDIVKTPDPGPAYIGVPHAFSIVVTNEGDSLAQNLEVVDTLPVDWVYDTGSTTIDGNPAGDPAIAGQDLTWSSPTLPNLDPDGSVTIVYTAHPVDGPLWPDPGAIWTMANTGGSFFHWNHVEVTVEDILGDTGNADGEYEDDTWASITIDRADVTIEKTHTGDPTAGDTFSWTVRVTNTGPDEAVGDFVVVDTLPADATYDGFEGDNWSVDVSSLPGQVTFTHPGPLANGFDLDELTVNVTLPANLAFGTPFDNSVTVSNETLDFIPGNNTFVDTATTVIAADIQLVKTTVGGPFFAGDTITWDIDVTNNGPSDAVAPFTVTDTLPATLDWSSVSTSGTGWTCNPVNGSGELVCTPSAATLDALASLPTLTVEATILPGVTGNIDNTADVFLSPVDLVPGNNTDTTSDPLGLADLSLIKTTTSLDIPANGTGTFRVDIANAGPSDALTVTVEDHLPGGLTYLNLVDMASTDTWSCVVNAGDPARIDCSLNSNGGILPNGGATWFEFAVRADATWSNTDVNTATVDSNTPDPDLTNNEDDSTTAPVLIVNKGAVPTIVERGSTVEYTINVQSMSYGSTDDVTLTDPIPSPLHVDSIVMYASTDPTVPGWSSCGVTGKDIDGYGGTLTCDLGGTLARGRTTPNIIVTATVRPSTPPGSLQNVATVEWVDTTGLVARTLSAVDDATIGVTLTGAELAATGTYGLLWRIALALALMALGGWFIIASRRMRTSEPEV